MADEIEVIPCKTTFPDEPSEGLDYCKVMVRDNFSVGSTADQLLQITGRVKRIDIQVPIDGVDLVAHVTITSKGVVTVDTRQKKYTGAWWHKLVELDVREATTLKRLEGNDG